jgi:nitrite reductase/ring-hydroxylating ferredoxin subunit
MAQFCLKTGAALTPPADKPVAAYAVVIEGGDVFVACDR